MRTHSFITALFEGIMYLTLEYDSEFWVVKRWSLFSVGTKLVATYRVQAANHSNWSIAEGNVSQC